MEAYKEILELSNKLSEATTNKNLQQSYNLANELLKKYKAYMENVEYLSIKRSDSLETKTNTLNKLLLIDQQKNWLGKIKEIVLDVIDAMDDQKHQERIKKAPTYIGAPCEGVVR